jgi:Ser/Thr protein kinase RdoA (MazF antagonist)
MTKDGNFKRAVRKHAREHGLRYTEARAALAKGRSADRPTRPFEHATLKAHLESTYGIAITSLAPIDDDPATQPSGSWPGHYPATLFVRRSEGTPWIARIYSSPADTVERVEGDAEILRFLAAHDFPAERPAHDKAVSVLDGNGVLVTEYVAPGRPIFSGTPEVYGEMGSLLGRLHTLPAGTGAVARDGGSEEHDGGHFVGRPKQDLAAAMSFLASVEDDIDASARADFEWLRDQVEQMDDAEGLPEALTHGNYHPWAAVGTPGNLHIVGWAGAGRGPRLPALAWLLRTAIEGGSTEPLAAALHGYREHVTLTDDELSRFASVANIRPLWLACLEYRMVVRAGHTPTLTEGWRTWRPEQGEHLADLVHATLSS